MHQCYYKKDHTFDDDSYITELKLDGFRTIWTKFDDKVKIHTRHNNEINTKFPELVNLPLPNGTVLDGEIVVTVEKGRPYFEAVMERFMSRKSGHDISFCVFDKLYFNLDRVQHSLILDHEQLPQLLN